jgi:folate-binding protein YgfZ
MSRVRIHKASYAELKDRGILEVGGRDAREFLQGIVTNDVYKVSAERAVHAALLSPQGKYLHDFFIVEIGGALCLECERGRIEDLVSRLSLYRLRSDVVFEDLSGSHRVAAAFGEGALKALGLPADEGRARAVDAGGDGGCVFVDPRLARLGARLILPPETGSGIGDACGLAPAAFDEYDRLRMSLGVPDGSRDLAVGKAILMENGFDELRGIDWEKGCFIGQEVTARTRYRGLVRKRLLPVAIEGDPPEPGTPVMLNDRQVGEMQSGGKGVGLALLRLDAVEEARETERPLSAGKATLLPQRPEWAAPG